jgi:hypothetical protein
MLRQQACEQARDNDHRLFHTFPIRLAGLARWA